MRSNSTQFFYGLGTYENITIDKWSAELIKESFTMKKILPIETRAGTDFGSIHMVNPPSMTIIMAGKYDWKNTEMK